MLKYLGYTITKKHSRDDNNYIATHNKTSKKINLFLNSGIMNNEKFQETMTSKSEKKYKRKNLCLIKLKREDLIKLNDMRRFIIKPNFNELDFINLIKKTFKLSLNTNAQKKLSDII